VTLAYCPPGPFLRFHLPNALRRLLVSICAPVLSTFLPPSTFVLVARLRFFSSGATPSVLCVFSISFRLQPQRDAGLDPEHSRLDSPAPSVHQFRQPSATPLFLRALAPPDPPPHSARYFPFLLFHARVACPRSHPGRCLPLHVQHGPVGCVAPPCLLAPTARARHLLCARCPSLTST